ncbi:MAG TPA: sigma-54 dependent transcriptional regulator [Gemmatimonadales bacterium]|nr:sigma-54 dependent transcriptional regulator [Gemmatimonadales bacterium]
MTLVLIVDDVAAMAEQYAYDIKRVGGYETITASGGVEALELLEREPVDCVVLDLEMPGMDGFDVLRALAERKIKTPVIVYTGTGTYDRCVQAVRQGAAAFIDKTEPVERVVQEIAGVLERTHLAGEVHALRHAFGAEAALVGSSPPMRALRETIAKLAPVPAAVLIVGESGAGKELVARDLHRQSGVRGPFFAVNAAALPEQLVESELFGHERGAFTGASAVRKGAFEAAADGTLFLDEIGELPVIAQAKLLRVLEQREVTRLGGTRALPVTARVVAATNRNLDEEIATGRFREDLYFRINAHVIRVPPLRERRGDIPELVSYLVATTCRRFGMRPRGVAPEVLTVLSAQAWRRNNVRELRNVVERLVLAADGERIELDDLPEELAESAGSGPRTLRALRAEAERRIVLDALERNDWHVTQTAKELGLADHSSLLKIMRRHGIRRD